MSAFDSAFNLDSMMGFGQKSRKGKKSKRKSSDPFDVLQMPRMSTPRKSKSKRSTTSFLDIPTPPRTKQSSQFGGFGGMGDFFGGVRSNGNGKKRNGNGNGSRRASAKDAAMGFEAPEFFGGLRAESQRPQSDGTFDDGMMKATPVQEGLGIQIPELGQDFNTRFGKIGSGFIENVNVSNVGFGGSGQIGGSGTKGLSELEREAFRREGRKGGRKSKLSDRERELITLGKRTKQDEEKKKKLLSELEKQNKRRQKAIKKEEKRRDKIADAEERAVERVNAGDDVERTEEDLRQEIGFTQAKSVESDEDFEGFTDDPAEEEKTRFTEEEVELGEGEGFRSNRIFGVGN